MTDRYRLRLLAFAALAALVSCRRPAVPPEAAAPPVAPELAAPAVAVDLPFAATVSYVQGRPSVRRAGTEIAAAEGLVLEIGDVVVTDGAASVEIAWAGYASVRVLPGTELVLRGFAARAFGGEERRTALLDLAGGAVLAKVRKLAGVDDFYVTTPNSAAGVRGTAFLVRYAPAAAGAAAATVVAVDEGQVALLPKGTLLDSLLGAKDANPLAGAVVRAAFAAAPAAAPGQALTIGGGAAGAGAAAADAADAAYAALLKAAERAAGAGIDLAAGDPAALLAAPGSAEALALAVAFATYSPAEPAAAERRALAWLSKVAAPGAAAPGGDRSVPVVPAVRASPALPGLLWTSPLATGPLADVLTRLGDRVAAVDAAGAVAVADASGAVAWRRKAGAAGGAVLTALADRLAAVDAAGIELLGASDGAPLGRASLVLWPGAASKAIPVPEGLVMATPRGLALVRADNAELIREILVPSGVAAPPVLAGRELVAVTGAGDLAVIDLASGLVVFKLDAGLGASSWAPRYRSGSIYAAGKGGLVVAAAVAERSLRWRRDLGVAVAAEPESAEAILYVWTVDKRLHLLAVSDGRDAAAAVGGVESAPLLSGGKLYWGDAAGNLVEADASDGRVLRRIATAEVQCVRPLVSGGVIYVGTVGGKLLKIDLSPAAGR